MPPRKVRMHFFRYLEENTEPSKGVDLQFLLHTISYSLLRLLTLSFFFFAHVSHRDPFSLYISCSMGSDRERRYSGRCSSRRMLSVRSGEMRWYFHVLHTPISLYTLHSTLLCFF